MLKSTRWIALAAIVSCLALPTFAAFSDLLVTTIALSGNTVTLTVQNPNPTTESARVRVAVVLDNGTTETLTSSDFSVPAESTIPLTLTASRSISGIVDAPEPITPY